VLPELLKLSLYSFNDGIVPPTINHFTDDENIDPKLNFTFNVVNVVMSNTFGFGGHNACVVKKLESNLNEYHKKIFTKSRSLEDDFFLILFKQF
jgi:hypothetical protein